MSTDEWGRLRRVVVHAVRSGLHCTIGSHNPDGSVHLTPIGSLILTDLGRGIDAAIIDHPDEPASR